MLIDAELWSHLGAALLGRIETGDFDRCTAVQPPTSVEMSSIIFKHLGLFLDEECPHHDVSCRAPRIVER